MEADLELISTSDLLDELCNRSNFAGVIVYQKDELRNIRPADVTCDRLRWSKTLTASKALVQLAKATKQLTNHLKKEDQGNG